MYVEGTVKSTDGSPIPNALIETWETDEHGFYDTQYKDRDHADCRGRLKTDKDGKYGYRAVTPVSYPIPGDVSTLFPCSPMHLLMCVQLPLGSCRKTSI